MVAGVCFFRLNLPPMGASLANPKHSTRGGGEGWRRREEKEKKEKPPHQLEMKAGLFDEGPKPLPHLPGPGFPMSDWPGFFYPPPTFVYDEWKHSPTLEVELGCSLSVANIFIASLEAESADL